MGWQFDLVILEVFPNLNDSMILWQIILQQEVEQKQLQAVYGTFSFWWNDILFHTKVHLNIGAFKIMYINILCP